MKPRITEGHFIVYYGPKGVADDKLHVSQPIFSESQALTRGADEKQKYGHAHINKINRKGKVIDVITVGLIAVPANAA